MEIDVEKVKKCMDNDLTVAPAVSVFMTTYNQEKYIERAINSVLEQRTNFGFELLIGEDCSTDDTRDIVQKYEKKYTNIKAVYHNQNVGIYRNEQSLWERCKGKYIAMLEGDDYWCDRNKLQIQFDFLEENKQFVGYAHSHYNDREGMGCEIAKINGGSYTRDDALKNRYLSHTSTFFFRNWFKYISKEQFEEFCQMKVLSHGKLVVASAMFGDWYIPPYSASTLMSVHRYHDSSWTAIEHYTNYADEYIRKITLKQWIEKCFGEQMKIDAFLESMVYSAFVQFIKAPKGDNFTQVKNIKAHGHYNVFQMIRIVICVFIRKKDKNSVYNSWGIK